MTTPASPADFTAWTARANAMSTDALVHSTRDALEAAAAAESIGNDVAAGRYTDEALTYLSALSRRRRRLAEAATDCARRRDFEGFTRATLELAAASAATQTLHEANANRGR